MNYDPHQLPNMTREQAHHIFSQRPDAYPYQVRSQAVAILQAEQESQMRWERIEKEL